jgi:hypothetical protein
VGRRTDLLYNYEKEYYKNVKEEGINADFPISEEFLFLLKWRRTKDIKPMLEFKLSILNSFKNLMIGLKISKLGILWILQKCKTILILFFFLLNQLIRLGSIILIDNKVTSINAITEMDRANICGKSSPKRQVSKALFKGKREGHIGFCLFI